MEKIEETLSLGVSIILSEICEQLLTKSIKNEDGTISTKDRDLPFRLRYRLTRNKVALDRDVEFFHTQRMIYLAQYGELAEDGNNVVLKDPQKLELYKTKVQDLFDTEVKHNIIKLDEEDIDQIRDIDINLSSDALGIFIGYMTNDKELLEDLSKEITINPTFKEFKPTEISTPAIKKVDSETKQIETPAKKTRKKTTITKVEAVETKVEEVKTEATKVEEVTEEKPAVKKSTKKKTATENTSTETTVKPSNKKTTKKKTTTKTESAGE